MDRAGAPSSLSLHPGLPFPALLALGLSLCAGVAAACAGPHLVLAAGPGSSSATAATALSTAARLSRPSPPTPRAARRPLVKGRTHLPPPLARPPGSGRGAGSLLPPASALLAGALTALWAALRRRRRLARASSPPAQLHLLTVTGDAPFPPGPLVPDVVVHYLQTAPLAAGIGSVCQLDTCSDELVQASQTAPPLDRLRLLEDAILPTSLALTYLYARPGVIPGIFDIVIAAPSYRRQMQRINPNDIKVDRTLGSGAFGEVYLATMKSKRSKGGGKSIVLKRAKEFGEAETWMNERVNRALPGVCARLIDSFEIKPTGDKKSSSTVFGLSGETELWLAFDYEGDKNLQDYLLDANFPYNLEVLLFGGSLRGPRSPLRALETVREVMRQLVRSLYSIHSIGIVHRDIKPQNIIVGFDGRLKLIDLGGAADLRTGINYYPRQYILDERYAAPEMFVMCSTTPAPPPIPIATFFAPALWLLNTPDRFDIYSLGIIFLQLCFTKLRTNSQIFAFNSTLKESYQYDLQAWRDDEEKRGREDYADGFALLDVDNGAGWDLLKRMLRPESSDRPSAQDILRSPFIKGVALPRSTPRTDALNKGLEAVGKQLRTITRALQRRLPLSEAVLDAQLREAADPPPSDDPKSSKKKKKTEKRGVFATQAWWDRRKRAVTIASRPPTLMERISDRVEEITKNARDGS